MNPRRVAVGALAPNLRLVALASLVCLTACTKSPELGFGIAVTVRFDDGIDAASRAALRSLLVTSSGDEEGDYAEPLPQGASAEEGFVYRPSSSTRSIALALVARSATAAVATGSTGTLTLSPGQTTLVEVLLRGPDSDMGSSGPVNTVAFQHAERYPGCAGARETALGDYDGDGRVDIAVTCFTAGAVQVFLGQADGSFPATPSSITTVLSPIGIAAVDFDADGHVDLVVMKSDGAHLLRNDSQGRFGDLATRPLVAATSVSTADFDKDGLVDLLVSGAPTEARVLWGSGAVASAFTTSAVLTLTGPPAQITAVDLDGDTFLDVAVFETGASKIELFHNTQVAVARSFAAATPITAYPDPYSAAFQDVNNDGRPEALVAIGAGGGYGFSVWSNTGGVLSKTNDFSLYQRHGLPTKDMLLVDIDHDKISDLVVASSSGSYVNSYAGLGPLQFDTGSSGVYWAGGNPGHAHAADLDQDGHEDLVLIDGDAFLVARGGAHAKLSAAEVFTFEQADDVAALATADLDHDGDEDVVIVSRGVGTAFAYLNDGKGQLRSTTSLPSLNTSCGGGTAVAVGDIDNDGQLDLVRAQQLCYDVVRGLGGGVLEQGPTGPTLIDGNLIEVGLADLDEDGRLDLVSIASGSGHLWISLGLGDGRFAAPTNIGISSPLHLVLADVNQDQHIDVIVAGGDGKISVFPNDGHAGLGTATQLTGPAGLSAIAVVDYDEDRIVDLVAAGNALYQWKGGPGFPAFSDAQRSSRSLLTPWQRLNVGDFNRDGHPDLVGSSMSGIEIYLGAGTSAFSAAHAFSFTAGLGPLLVADVDGDRLPDLIVGGNGSHPGAAILRNRSH